MKNIGMSYDEMLEAMSMGNNYENGEYGVSNGVVIISGDCSDEIDFVEFRENELRKAV